MLRSLAFLAALGVACPAMAADIQTIVFMRHGEKPEGGLGQLTCQGLNRALALPSVLAQKFGAPQAIFAPAPTSHKDGSGQKYNYIRPLATIEPTAIRLGLPVNAQIDKTDIDALQAALSQPDLANATVLVAWEHKQIAKMVRRIVSAAGGEGTSVPKWKGGDFDSLYVVKIARSGGVATVRFELDHEGLDGQSTTCPGP
jgi:hypothetical protein